MSMRKVLISPDFGGGFSTWNDAIGYELCTDPQLISLVEAGRHSGRTSIHELIDSGAVLCDELVQEAQLPSTYRLDPRKASLAFCKRAYEIAKGDYVYFGGVDGLRVVEVEGGFRIGEYDGAESIELESKKVWW